eukprot:541554-Pelagomonas_calceolata.AAC.2
MATMDSLLECPMLSSQGCCPTEQPVFGDSGGPRHPADVHSVLLCIRGGQEVARLPQPRQPGAYFSVSLSLAAWCLPLVFCKPGSRGHPVFFPLLRGGQRRLDSNKPGCQLHEGRGSCRACSCP